MEKEFCKCSRSKGVSTAEGDFGYWVVCVACGKRLEDSFVYYNHYDGEDHCDDDLD